MSTRQTTIIGRLIDALRAIADEPTDENRETARALADELSLLASTWRAGVDWSKEGDQRGLTVRAFGRSLITTDADGQEVEHQIPDGSPLLPSLTFEIDGAELVSTDSWGNENRRPMPEGVAGDWLPELAEELAQRFNLHVDDVTKRLQEFAEQHGRHVPQFVRKDRPPCDVLTVERDPTKGLILIRCEDSLHDYQIDPQQPIDVREIAAALAVVHQWDPAELTAKLYRLTTTEDTCSFKIHRKG